MTGEEHVLKGNLAETWDLGKSLSKSRTLSCSFSLLPVLCLEIASDVSPQLPPPVLRALPQTASAGEVVVVVVVVRQL